MDAGFFLKMIDKHSNLKIEVTIMENGESQAVSLLVKQIKEIENCPLEKIIILPHANGLWQGRFTGMDDDIITLTSLVSGNKIGVPKCSFTAYLQEV